MMVTRYFSTETTKVSLCFVLCVNAANLLTKIEKSYEINGYFFFIMVLLRCELTIMNSFYSLVAFTNALL